MMDNKEIINKELENVGHFFKGIREIYKKEKCMARELEIMIYIHNNPNTTIKRIHTDTELLHTVTSKYVKNLCEHKFVLKKSNLISPNTILINFVSELIKNEYLTFEQSNKNYDKSKMSLSQLGIFIKKIREVYDEKNCTARDIELMIYIYLNHGTTISEIVKNNDMNQPIISKFISKLEKSNLILRTNRKIIPTNKLNYCLEFAMTKAFNL